MQKSGLFTLKSEHHFSPKPSKKHPFYTKKHQNVTFIGSTLASSQSNIFLFLVYIFIIIGILGLLGYIGGSKY